MKSKEDLRISSEKRRDKVVLLVVAMGSRIVSLLTPPWLKSKEPSWRQGIFTFGEGRISSCFPLACVPGFSILHYIYVFLYDVKVL
jgi:hypothetical protein